MYHPISDAGLIFYIDVAMKMNPYWNHHLNTMVKTGSQSQFLPYVAYTAYHTHCPLETLERKWFEEKYNLLNQYMVQLQLSDYFPRGLPYPFHRVNAIQAFARLMGLPEYQVEPLYDAWDLMMNPDFLPQS